MQTAVDWAQRHRKLLLSFTSFVLVGGVMTTLGMFLLFMLVEVGQIHPIAAFLPQNITTMLLGYALHRQTTFPGEHLDWRTNLRRWGTLRAMQLAAGFALFGFLLSIVGLPYLVASLASGGLLLYPSFKYSRKWAFAGQVKEAKA